MRTKGVEVETLYLEHVGYQLSILKKIKDSSKYCFMRRDCRRNAVLLLQHIVDDLAIIITSLMLSIMQRE